MARFFGRLAWLPALVMIWFWAPAAGAASAAHAPPRVAWMTSPRLHSAFVPFSRPYQARTPVGEAQAGTAGVVRLSSSTQSSLSDVSVISATNAWAVGVYCPPGSRYLILG